MTISHQLFILLAIKAYPFGFTFRLAHSFIDTYDTTLPFILVSFFSSLPFDSQKKVSPTFILDSSSFMLSVATLINSDEEQTSLHIYV
jgi:hypothetical protein